MKRVLVVVALSAAACTSPNPRSCVDGTCTDPAFPFCDVDGSFEGAAETCIAVACTPDEHVTCRGQTSYFCNAVGNDYEQRQCPNGCDDAVGGCIAAERCSMNADCVNPTPVCEAEVCRACRTDDECDSTVCDRDTGACVASTAILYASPTGAGSGNCTQDEPCTVARAITTAGTSGLGKTVRMLPGNYSEPLLIQGNTIVRIVATGATLSTSTSGVNLLRVIGGATAEIRGLTGQSTASSGGIVTCGDQSLASPKSSLTFLDGSLQGSGGVSTLRAFRCNLRMEGATVAGSASVLSFSDDASFEGDRLLIRPSVQGTSILLNFLGKRMSGRLTNSVVIEGRIANNASDDAAPGSNVYAAFNTFVLTNPNNTITCENSGNVKLMRWENNIIYAQGTGLPAVFQPNGCSFANNIITPQTDLITNNRDVDPKFVDFAAGNYKLQADSPAVNTGVPSTELSPLHDHDGVMRPQGAGHDVGAFERTP